MFQFIDLVQDMDFYIALDNAALSLLGSIHHEVVSWDLAISN
jgi:hypothetical protein